ncbi:MAG: xanthine dehydrogenase family protein molybdopterin-binding subunit, partial [Bryobacterales bacterium]|nr:xanthine dehydrogenase family protein molybdopterin-binding subunit [Bryobacterales bacterium]
KHTGEAAIEAARLAREAKRPVQLRWTRQEEFAWAYCRPAALIEIRAGLDANGKLAVWEFINYNAGASGLRSPYASPALREEFLRTDTPLRQGSYRALASTANNFAREAAIDELAAAAGQDPFQFRMAHLRDERMRAVLTAAAERFGWDKRHGKTGENRATGIACGTEKNSVVATCAEVEVDPKTGIPRVVELCTAYECGAILNPAGLLQQVEGCMVMALGAVLREELRFANGMITNGRFRQYRVPRFRDMPKMDVVLLDRKSNPPVGAGETPMMSVGPAVANAVFAVSGKPVRQMPVRGPRSV